MNSEKKKAFYNPAKWPFQNLYLLLLLLFIIIIERASLYCTRCPRTRYADQDHLELTEIFAPLLPECWNEKYVHSPTIFKAVDWQRACLVNAVL